MLNHGRGTLGPLEKGKNRKVPSPADTGSDGERGARRHPIHVKQKAGAADPTRKRTDVTTVDARNNFSDLVNRAAYGKEQVVLTRRGRAVAAIVPIEDLIDGELLNEKNLIGAKEIDLEGS